MGKRSDWVYGRNLIADGTLTAAQAKSIAAASSAGLDSLDSINALPPELQTLVRDAFRDGSRWAFISLVPWCALAFVVSLALSRIPDGDRGVAHAPETPKEPALHYDAAEKDASSPDLSKVQDTAGEKRV